MLRVFILSCPGQIVEAIVQARGAVVEYPLPHYSRRTRRFVPRSLFCKQRNERTTHNVIPKNYQDKNPEWHYWMWPSAPAAQNDVGNYHQNLKSVEAFKHFRKSTLNSALVGEVVKRPSNLMLSLLFVNQLPFLCPKRLSRQTAL